MRTYAWGVSAAGGPKGLLCPAPTITPLTYRHQNQVLPLFYTYMSLR
jgi:hypothetical protein